MILTAFALSLMACKTRSVRSTSIEQIAGKELGNDFTIDFNESKTFAMCKQTRTTDHINSVFNYCIVSTREKKIVHRGSYQQGSVRWLDNDKIEVITTEKFSTESIRKTIQINPSQP
jgi:hypothetical protein